MSDNPEYVLERTFKAPRDLVWRAWTEPELLSRWYGPNVETTIHQFDLKVGGLWLGAMSWGGNTFHSKQEFTAVTPPDYIAWLQSSTDAEWNVIPSPMMPNWPKTCFVSATFTETDGETHMRLTTSPHEASAEEIAAFAAIMGNMDSGWASGMDILDGMLAELQSA